MYTEGLLRRAYCLRGLSYKKKVFVMITRTRTHIQHRVQKETRVHIGNTDTWHPDWCCITHVCIRHLGFRDVSKIYHTQFHRIVNSIQYMHICCSEKRQNGKHRHARTHTRTETISELRLICLRSKSFVIIMYEYPWNK